MTGTIVVTLDRSTLAETALPLARQLAERTGFRILLVSVIAVPPELSLWFHIEEVAHEWVRRCTDVQEYLDQVANSLVGLKVDTLVRSGNPVAEIIRAVQDVEHPLLVMASHGHSGIKRMMVGSITAQTVHSAPCPVIVVRAQENLESSAPYSFDHLLIALDGSPFAEEALDVARAVFGQSGLDLHLLRVVETSTPYVGGYDGLDDSTLAAYYALDSYLEWAREDAAAYLERVSAGPIAEGNEVTWQVREGLSALQIVQYAEQCGAGLIVMATHGRTGLGRALLGSVADQVLHESILPLLLVRPREAGTQQAPLKSEADLAPPG